MKCYGFSIILKGVPFITEEIADKLFEAGCDDCSPGSHAEVTRADFDREAESLESAISSAVADVRKAGYEAERIEIVGEDIALVAG